MAQPGPNFGRTGLAHRVGPILPPLPLLVQHYEKDVCLFDVILSLDKIKTLYLYEEGVNIG